MNYYYRNKPVLHGKEHWLQENRLNKLRTVVSEVSSFVGTMYTVHCTGTYVGNHVYLYYRLNI